MVHRRLPTAAISHSRFTAPHQPTFCTCMNSYFKSRRTTVTCISVLQGIKPVSSDVGAHKRFYHQPTRETKTLTYPLRLPRYLKASCPLSEASPQWQQPLACKFIRVKGQMSAGKSRDYHEVGYAFIPHTALPTRSSTTSLKDDL